MKNHCVLSCVTLAGGSPVRVIQREGEWAGQAGERQRCTMGTVCRGKSNTICVLHNCGGSLKNISLITLKPGIRWSSGSTAYDAFCDYPRSNFFCELKCQSPIFVSLSFIEWSFDLLKSQLVDFLLFSCPDPGKNYWLIRLQSLALNNQKLWAHSLKVKVNIP